MTYAIRLAILIAILQANSTALALEKPADRDAAAEAVLKDKGLTRVGFMYLLDDDVHLPEVLRQVRQTRNTIDRSNAQRARIEAEIRDAADKIDALNRELREVNAAQQGALTPIDRNRLVARNNIIVSNLSDGKNFLDRKHKELDILPNPIDDYITAVQTLADKMESTSKRYITLSDDPAVKAALASINAHAPPRVSLGPSAQFTEVKPSILKQRDTVNSSVIKLQMKNGVPCVAVTLNGEFHENMIVDSGAAIMTLPHAVAAHLGYKPHADDQIIECITASGAHVKSHIMHIKSVRLGQFIVNDVVAAVLPTGMGEDGLLGGTFLHHFVYRMDLEAHELHLSQVGGKPALKTEPAHASSTSSPTDPSHDNVADGGWISHMTGATTQKDEEGNLILVDEDRISTIQSFTPPIRFHVIAKTDSNNIRLSYGVKQIVFDWELDRRDLRIDGFPGSQDNRQKPGAGSIAKNKWADIELTVLPDSLTIVVNGNERYHGEGDFSKVNEPLSVFTHDAKLTVKSVESAKP